MAETESEAKDATYSGPPLTEVMHIRALNSDRIKLCIHADDDAMHTELYGEFAEVTAYAVSFMPLDPSKTKELADHVKAALERIAPKTVVKYSSYCSVEKNKIMVAEFPYSVNALIEEMGGKAEFNNDYDPDDRCYFHDYFYLKPTDPEMELETLRDEFWDALKRLKNKDEFRFGRFGGIFSGDKMPTYAYERDGEIKTGDLTFIEARALYRELGKVILPSLETAQAMAKAAKEEMRGPLSGVIDLPSFDENVHPYHRKGNLDKAGDGAFDEYIDTLREIYATGEITASELRERTATLALHILSGQIKDPTEEFLSLERLLEQRAADGNETASTALIIRVSADQALSHPIIQKSLPEMVLSMTDGLLRTITGDRMGADILENRTETEQWRQSLGKKLAQDYRENAEKEFQARWSGSTSWSLGDLQDKYKEEKRESRPEEESNTALAVLAQRELARILPVPKFIERDFSGNLATKGQLGPIESTKDQKSGRYHSRLPNSRVVPAENLPDDLQAILDYQNSEAPEIPRRPLGLPELAS